MPPPPMPLQCAAGDERRHVGRHRAQHRARDEQADRREHHDAAAVDVGELAVERRHHGRGQQIGDDDPGQVLEVAEVAADGRQGGGDDGLIERGQEHAQHQAVEDIAHVRLAQRRMRCGGGKLGLGRLGGFAGTCAGRLAARIFHWLSKSSQWTNPSGAGVSLFSPDFTPRLLPLPSRFDRYRAAGAGRNGPAHRAAMSAPRWRAKRAASAAT